MNSPRRIIIIVLIILFICFSVWFFSSLFIYLISAIMLSFIGNSIVRLLTKIKIGKHVIPKSVRASIALIIIIGVFGLLIGLFVPIIISQANFFTNIDLQKLSVGLEKFLAPLEYKLIQYRLMGKNETIITILSDQFLSLIRVLDFSSIVNYVISFTGKIFIGVFAVIFIAFFLLKDEYIVYDTIMLLTPDKYHSKMETILDSSKKLLTRYFAGLCIDVFLITSCYFIGLSIFGIKNALLIAFVAGVLHVIPYLGPMIGGVIGVVLGISATLAVSPFANLLPIVLIILGVFVVVNLIDNFVFQPLIYSNSVKAHPLEIFFIVLIGDTIAGIPGMILAIPFYTLIRIVAKEFFIQFPIVQKLTERL